MTRAVDPNAHWITETSLDLDMVSAICPNCHILLVQANTNADSDLATAELTAASTAPPFNPQQITNSWSWTGDNTHNAAFSHSTIAVVAATGDGGYNTFGVPAQLPYVTAVGGTSLPAANNARGFSETAWSGTASGCATGNAKPSWQKDSGCSSRTVARRRGGLGHRHRSDRLRLDGGRRLVRRRRHERRLADRGRLLRARRRRRRQQRRLMGLREPERAQRHHLRLGARLPVAADLPVRGAARL